MKSELLSSHGDDGVGVEAYYHKEATNSFFRLNCCCQDRILVAIGEMARLLM